MARLRRDAPASNPIDDLTALFQKATKDFTQTVEESTVLKEIKEKFNNINSVSIEIENFSFIFFLFLVLLRALDLKENYLIRNNIVQNTIQLAICIYQLHYLLFKIGHNTAGIYRFSIELASGLRLLLHKIGGKAIFTIHHKISISFSKGVFFSANKMSPSYKVH